MTTSVIYDSEARQADLAANAAGTAGNVTLSTIYSNLDTMLDTGVTLVQQVNNSATGTNPNATFTSTPTNGNALIAILARGGDNAASTGPTGWTQLTAQGAAGARRLEMWWKRAGASEATLHTWTNATSGLWDLILIEFGGWAAKADPVTITGGTNSTTTTTASFASTGYLESVCAVVTSGGSAGTFTNTGTNAETVTDLPFTTTTRFRAMSVDAWTNRADQTNQITYTTSRPHTRAQVGWYNGYDNSVNSGTFGAIVGNDLSTNTTYCGQRGYRFATGTIPDGDTVTSATITLKSGPFGASWPANTAVNVYSLNAAAISASNSNTRGVWKKPSEIAALTRVATRAAGSAWVIGTQYTWTSDATFPAAINKTGDTTLLVATGDQQSGTTRSTAEYANFDLTVGTVNYLTIVHNLQATRTVSVTTGMTPTVSRLASFLRTIATTVSTSPTISRLASFPRTIATNISSDATVSRLAGFPRTIATTVTGSATVSQVASFLRTIATTVTGNATITATFQPFVQQVARVIRLGARSTIQIGQIVVARIAGRSTIRAPKE